MEDKFEEIELTTKHLQLKRAHADLHAKEINAGVCDTIDSLREFIPWAKDIPSVEDTRMGLQRVCGQAVHYSFRVYPIDEVKFIGMCGLRFDEKLNVYEVGYWIQKSYTRRGFASEAVECVLNFGINTLKWKEFTLICNEQNIPSKKIAEKFGFQLERKERTTEPSRPEWGEIVLLYHRKSIPCS